jgi:mannose-6-phosphate isomerase-like protein (cupin superfamily)
MMLPIVISPSELEMHRISDGDTVRLAVLAGPEVSPVTVILESWYPAGAQPPNSHPHSTELFLFLRGQGRANCDGHEVDVRAGDTLVLPQTSVHYISNTGPGRMYTITVMSPDDGFADLVRRGPPAETDDEDRAVLAGLAGGSGGQAPRAGTAARL